jgi:peptidoglycan/xylan/chitin deacetylase (PgdA/CDA1 family)
MCGFLYRSTIVAACNLLRRRISFSGLLKLWRAAVLLPFVYLGWAKDFWEPFDWYLRVERGLPATYFLIPFKRRAGEHVPGPHPSRRATAYDITDLSQETTTRLMKDGCELGVHGIDAWHSTAKARDELARIATVTGSSDVGIRMHWLLRDVDTPGVLEKAGYAYDSTVGFNETVGFRAGTTQVFRPVGARALLELPVHIQDGALFYSQRLDLSEAKAEQLCRALIATTTRAGGVLTVIWHDRSHGPERLWGDFYVRLIDALRSSGAWFGTASQAVEWFRKRREVHFERGKTSGDARPYLRYDGEEIQPPLRVRVHQARSKCVDIPWNGKADLALELPMECVPAGSLS